MGFFLLIISWLLRTYGAVQEQRSPIDTPAIWGGDIAKLLLSLVWIILLVIGIYLVFTSYGVITSLISIFIYFVIAPALFGKIIKKLLDQIGV